MAVQKKGQTMEEAGKGRKTIPDTLAELFAGITASALLVQGVIVWLVKDRLSYSIGLWIGAALAAGLAWHMWRTLDQALDLGEAGAQKQMRRQSALRYGVVILVLGVLMMTQAANPLAAFLGIMTLKVAAYLQPVTHKVIIRLRR